MKKSIQCAGAFCIGMQLARIAAGCSSGETRTEYDIPDAASDAEIIDAGREDATDAPSCNYHACTEGIWICEICTCPGMTCMHEYVYQGENPNAPDASIIIGTCDENLKCSVKCPSLLCAENPKTKEKSSL